jgi:hypothetical protein
LVLPLSKQVGKYIAENSGEKEGKWSKGRQKKLVLHFNSRFKEALEAKRVPLVILDMMVMLTDIVILEIDNVTFKGDRTFLQIYTKYVMDISLATETPVHFCVFIEPKIET